MKNKKTLLHMSLSCRLLTTLILATALIATAHNPSLAASPKWGIPKSCEIPEMLDKHPNYVMKQQIEMSSPKNKVCVMNTPAVLENEPKYLDYTYSESKLSFKKFMNAELKRFSVTNEAKLEVSSLTVKKTKCDIFVVYNESTYPWDLYWKYIKCSNGVARIIGYEFDKNNYKNDSFALLIAGHMKK